MVNAKGAIALELLIVRDRRTILTSSDPFRWPGPLLNYICNYDLDGS